eukprot:jgi/Orpsp1_1/1186611/evm.model.d7180000051921.1
MMTVYFPLSLERHRLEKSLANFYSPDIIFGDFNIDINSFQDPKKKLLTLSVYLQKYSLQYINPTLKNRYSNIPKWDHVFSKSTLNINVYTGLPPFFTDHQSIEIKINLGQCIDLAQIQNPSDQLKKKFNLASLKDPLIRSSLIHSMNQISDTVILIFSDFKKKFITSDFSIKQQVVNQSDELLLKLLQDCCTELLGTFHSNTKVYETSSYRDTFNMDTSNDYFNSKKYRQIDDKISHSVDMNTTTRLFKEHLKNSSSNPQYIESADPNCTPLEDVFNYFTKAYQCLDTNNSKFNPFNIRDIYLGIEYPDFYNYINYEVIISKINNLSSNKACGEDGIHSLILKALLDSRFPRILESLFKMCAKFGVTPLRWNSSIIFPIPKKKDSPLIKDYRPIAITNLFRKLFESLLLDFINQYLSKYFKLCKNQAGFRRGFSTLTHALLSNETAKTFPIQYHVFLDLKKAYDSVPLKALLEKLEDRKIPMGIISPIASLFSGCTTKVLVNNQFTDEITLERGLLQGFILSPLLFNIFIDDLAMKLTLSYPNDPLPHYLFFADDIKLNHYSLSALQNMLNICSRWAEENGMEFNINKSSYLINSSLSSSSSSSSSSSPSSLSSLSSPSTSAKSTKIIECTKSITNRINKSIHLFLVKNGMMEELPGVEEYKYLGFPHTSSGINWRDHLERSSKKSLNLLKSLYYFKNAWPTSSKLLIFRTFIRPMMEHSACLAFYWMDHSQFMKKTSTLNYEEVSGYHEVTTEAIEWIVNSSKYKVACCLLGLPPTMLRLYILALKFRIHLNNMDDENPLKSAFDKSKNVFLSMDSFAGRLIERKDIFKLKYFNLPPARPKFNPNTKVRICSSDIDDIDYRIKVMIKNYFLNLKSDSLILPSSRTEKVINPTEKSIIISSDRCIYIRDRMTRYYSIKWRLNNFIHKRPCPICGDNFNRGHINECKFIDYEPYKSIVKDTDLSLFNEDKVKFKDLPSTYNILDSLLNHKNYNRF